MEQAFQAMDREPALPQLRLKGRRVLVVATPAVALARLALRGGARVDVCTRQEAKTLLALAEHCPLSVLRGQAFEEAMLDGAWLCLTDDPAVAKTARQRGLLVALPDHPEESDLVLPASSREAGGRASLVGAGPGHPSLLTLRAREVLSDADVVLHDRLPGEAVLAMAPPWACRIDVGKRCGRHAMSQAAINRLIIDHVRAGAHVVRLKGGDPFVFGRGGEELDSLHAAEIPVEVVPGVTAACAAAASLGVPLTFRDLSRSLHLVTGHGSNDGVPPLDWAALARSGGTVALYMGGRTLAEVSSRLIEGGMAGSTPAVAVESVSLAEERHLVATLATLPALLAANPGTGPVLVLIGAVVGRLSQGALRAA